MQRWPVRLVAGVGSVAALSRGDMIALAAYLSTLTP